MSDRRGVSCLTQAVTSLYHILSVLLGYLVGSVPVGYLVGKLYGVDVRTHGSGRTGGTNVWRATKHVVPPLLTILGDIAKGLFAVWLGRLMGRSELSAALAGAGAVFGHNWSLFLGFKGGAGGVTAAACLTAINWIAGAITVPIAILVLYLTRYASVGTLTASVGGLLVLAALRWAAPGLVSLPDILYGILSSIFVVWALRPNIRRLWRRTERRITLW